MRLSEIGNIEASKVAGESTGPVVYERMAKVAEAVMIVAAAPEPQDESI